MKPEKLLCTVYGLLAEGDDHYRYIGQTQVKLSRRLASHWNTARNTNSQTYVYRWMRKCEREGSKITIHVIEENCYLNLIEIEWIACFKEIYNDMTNISIGGDYGSLGLKRSEETKAKMRKSKSESTKKKMRKPKSDATKKKMSMAQLGNTKSRGENNRHAVITAEDVLTIREECSRDERRSLTEIGNSYGIQKAAVWKIKERLCWKHV